MLTDSSLALIAFINLFFVPFISLRIYSKRVEKEWKLDFEHIYYYAIFCCINIIGTKVLAIGFEKIFSILLLVDSTKYTLVAVISAFILPYIVEMIEKNVKIDVDINKSK